MFKHNGTFVKTKGYCTDVLFKSTLGWIQSVKDSDQPFFAYLSTNAPHSPFVAPPKYQQYFQDLGFPRHAAGFYGMIEHIDHCMGQMFEQLEAWGLLDNTIVIFTSDNGMTRVGCGLRGVAGRPQVQLGTDKDGKPMMSDNAGMKGLKNTVDEGARPGSVLRALGWGDQARPHRQYGGQLLGYPADSGGPGRGPKAPRRWKARV